MIKSYTNMKTFPSSFSTGQLSFTIYFMIYIGAFLIGSPIEPELLVYIFSGLTFLIFSIFGVIIIDKILLDKYFLFFILFYYIWLVVNQGLENNVRLLLYLFATPLVIFVLVILGPTLLEDNRMILPTFLSFAGAILFIIGIILLFVEANTGLQYPGHTGRNLFGIYNIRVTSIFYNGNAFAHFLSISTLSSIYLFLKDRKYALILFGLNLISLFLTQGRSAYLGLLIGITILFGYKYAKYFSISIIGGISVGILAVVFILNNNFAVTNLLSGRGDIWAAELQAVSDSPLIGVNYNSPKEELASYMETNNFPGGHGSYTSILGRFGIPGGFAYLSSILYIFIKFGENITSTWDRYIIAGFSSLIVIMAFETFTFGGLSTDPILLGTFIGLAHHQVISRKYSKNV